MRKDATYVAAAGKCAKTKEIIIKIYANILEIIVLLSNNNNNIDNNNASKKSLRTVGVGD